MKRVKQVTYGAIGIIMLVVGVLGLILPVLPGLILIFAGLIFLALEIPALDASLNKAVSKNVKVEYYYAKARHFIRTKLGYEL